jgi:type III pantothenate kinase
MANLVIDIGNTLIKVAVFRQDDLLQFEQYQAVDNAVLPALISKYHIKRAIISSVRNETGAWRDAIAANIEVTNFSTEMSVGIINHYRTPNTLGPDRLAAVIGAHKLYPAENTMIIGAGTAITYDYVDAGGNYFGGSISPGLNMRYKALNYYTGALPLLAPDTEFNEGYGNDTAGAIRSGVQNGIKFELNGFIDSYHKDAKGMNIILTGGDSIFFDTLLKNSIFATCIKNEPYLVLKGLNAVIQYNND